MMRRQACIRRPSSVARVPRRRRTHVPAYLCFDLPFEPRNVVVTPDKDGGRPTHADRNYVFGASLTDRNGYCPATHTEAVVHFFPPGIPFFVMFN